MKTVKYYFIGIFFCSFLLLTGCVEDDAEDNFYTFTGEMLSGYLENRKETYSDFLVILEKAEMRGLLNTYGSYTCFAPTNTAMQTYLSSKGIANIDDVTKEEATTIAYNHLISNKYLTTDLATGAIPKPNMGDRYLMVSFTTDSSGNLQVVINEDSKIILKDEEVENGVVHTINQVLSPSNAQIPDLIASNPDLSIFSEALVLTGMADSLRKVLDETYVQVMDFKDHNGNGHADSPEKRKFGYTVFVESNTILANSSAHITDLAGLTAYAKKVYDRMYPQDASITDPTDRRNSLNRFVSYHLINKTIYYNTFVYTYNSILNIDHYEFTETMLPHTLVKVMDGVDGLRINRRIDRIDAYLKGIKILSQEETRYDQNAINGTYHCIEDLLVYDESVRDVVLNDRLRFDASGLLPELMTNGVRQVNKLICFPQGYFDNLEFSNETNFYYLDPHPNWCNYQGDEMMATGQYDFTIKLPPVPEGTYEIRFAYTANPKRGMAQFYYISENEITGARDSKPVGIPLDLRLIGTNAKIGWVADSPTDESVGIETDKMMRNRGYMKGPDTFFKTEGGVEFIGRGNSDVLRRIIGTFDIKNDETHYLRFKSVLDDNLAQFMFDYLEIVPKSVYGSPEGENRH
ncbi:fasciclin domain-containing protein [Viscerimonas tarda]